MSIVKVEKFGKSLLVIFDDGERVIAYPGGGNLWFPTGGGDGPGPDPDPDPDPEPVEGDFAWHFRPTPAPEGDMPPVGSSDAPLAEFGPRQLTGAFHEGMDFGYGSATAGANIRATGAGTVFSAGWGSWGNSVVLFHGRADVGSFGSRDVYTRHGHMASIAVSEGQEVDIAHVLGTVGNTGPSLGPHDHYEVHLCEPGQPMVNNTADPGAFRTAVNPRDFHNIMGNEVL